MAEGIKVTGRHAIEFVEIAAMFESDEGITVLLKGNSTPIHFSSSSTVMKDYFEWVKREGRVEPNSRGV